MPGGLVSHRSGAHRFACFSLYRALLRQCSLLVTSNGNKPDGQPFSSALRNIIRYRFHKDRKLVSPSQIANGLKTGSSLLDLLQNCNAKSPIALASLTNLLESTISLADSTFNYRESLARARSQISSEKLTKVAHIRANATKANHTRHAESKPVLERPLPLSEIKGGKRKVPSLVAAHGIPFLRYNKRQPISLGRVLRQLAASGEKKWKQKHAVEVATVFAEYEDTWDNIVHEQHGVTSEPQGGTEFDSEGEFITEEKTFLRWKPETQMADIHTHATAEQEPKWTEELVSVDRMLYTQIRDRDAKHAQMARNLWEVVVKEREMARQEKIQRRIERKAAAVRALGELEAEPDAGPVASHGAIDGDAAKEERLSAVATGA